MNAFVLTLCLAAATVVSPESQSHKPHPFKPVTGAFMAFSVPNMAASVQWYTQKLGLAIVLQQQSGGLEVTVLEGAGLMVELIRDPAARPATVSRPELLHGVYKAGFFVKDFDDVVDELRARGVAIAFGPFPQHDNQRANVIIRDNAGNLIQIFGE